MRHLNGVYTQAFNRRHMRTGHVLQGRFKAILVEKETHLLELAQYVVLNPVRARAVRSARDGPWSSYRATAGMVDAPDFLTTSWILAQFHRSPRRAIELYRKFVKQGRGVDAWAELRGGILLGSDEFAHPGGLVYCSEPQATHTRGKESRSDSQATQPRLSSPPSPFALPWMAQMTGAAFQNRAVSPKSPRTPKLLVSQAASHYPRRR
jgi:hypothetical protein